MFYLHNAVPDVEALLALEPEELGAKLLFLIRKHDRPDKFHPGNMILDVTNAAGGTPSGAPSPYSGLGNDVGLALSEAFSWLEAQGLIVPYREMSGMEGWCRLSRRARRFESEEELAQYAVARHLRKEMLHPRIASKVWMTFVRGEYDAAVFQAMKAVEVAVREASGLLDLIGVTLMRQAFRLDSGPLTDRTSEKGEQEARCSLFAGAIGSFKNPQSHRDVNLENAAEATEVILLANHLLRIVDERTASRG